MNKFVLTLCSLICLFTTHLSCVAFELFPYKTQTPQSIGGTIKSNGCEDLIVLPSDSDTNFMKELFAPSAIAVAAATVFAVDPYVVPIDGINYVMVKDKQTSDWGEQDLLGYEDPKEDLFLSLRNLESDGNNSKITPQELKKAGIRFVKLAEDGTLLVKDRTQDLNLNKIKYIDIKNLRRTANSQNTGIFGHFYVYLNTDDGSRKMAVGYVTFDTHSNLKIMFQ